MSRNNRFDFKGECSYRSHFTGRFGPAIYLLLFFTAFTILFPVSVTAQPSQASHIDRIGLKEGLSNDEVRCIFQDHTGFIWFGTYDGLNRFDGYDFRIYQNQPEDDHSLIHSYVNCITEDADNNIWVGTRQGVCVLNPLTEQFSPLTAVRDNGKPFVIRNYIRGLAPDRNGNIFVASSGSGLIEFDRYSKAGNAIPLSTRLGKIWNYDADALTVLPDRRIFVVIKNSGLYQFIPEKKNFRLVDSTVATATCLYFDGKGLWIGNTHGLARLNLRTNTYDRVFNEADKRLRSHRVTSLQIMPDRRLWIGTDAGGVQIYDIEKNQISYLSAGYDDTSLSSDAVCALMLDKEGRKWIGTLRGGINVIDDVKDRFRNIRHDPLKSNSLINNFIKSVYEDRSGKLWVGTDGGGLSIWNPHNGNFINYQAQPDVAGHLSSNFITSIVQDSVHAVWMTTYGGGINRIDPDTHVFKIYKGKSGSGKEDKLIFWSIYLDGASRLWASALQDGLYLYDPHSDQFNLYNPKLTNVLSMEEGKSGILWAGGFDGLYAIDTKSSKYRFYSVGTPIRAVHADEKKNLWLGTEAGLMYFDTSVGKAVKQFTTRAGLSNNNILSIEEDRDKNLWLSTYSGLCRFNPINQSFTSFYQSDGLASKEFNFNASARLKNGQLAFGGMNGLTLFDPQELIPLHNAPNIALTDIRIDGKPLNQYPDNFTAGQQNELTSIRVPYRDASFSFRYAAIEFTAQERIKYRYQLEGWDRSWMEAGRQRNILYSRLSPGTYTLRIKSTNPEGQWTTKELSLKITVLPPWYATIWAYIVYILILAGIIYWYLRHKFQETKLKYEIELAKTNAEYQRNLQEKEKELNERRLEFFTGVSHEFRTPLSLIINPIKDLLSKSDGTQRQDLNIIYRNSKRLLSLVDQLLLFRKADAVSDTLQIAPMDIGQVCNEVHLCFVQQAKLAGIQFNWEIPVSPVLIFGDREKIEVVLFNLISNAIKYTPQGNEVTITLSEYERSVTLEVKDGGPGISPEAGAHIFDKFYRAAKQGQMGGFGIGLYLAQQYTRRHHGDLTFKSNLDVGTTFILQLLKGTSHFPGVVVTETIEQMSPLLDEMAGKENPVDVGDDVETADFDIEKLFTDKKMILIIDDDADIRKYIRSILENKYVVYEAADGQTGLQKIKERHPDLIVCDVMMPGVNGLELCAIIKNDEQLSYIPMILLTASSSPENRIKGLESGADDYIPKPFEKDVLLARIANLLQTRDNLQHYFYNTITLKSSNVSISDEYKQFLEKCISIVEAHLTDEEFSIKVLAAEIGMSHRNLYRKVKSLSGHTINSFIRFIRLRKAAELLIQSDMNVNEVAYQTGFNSIKYFRTQFFKLFGTNPSEFLKQKRPIFKRRFNVKN